MKNNEQLIRALEAAGGANGAHRLLMAAAEALRVQDENLKYAKKRWFDCQFQLERVFSATRPGDNSYDEDYGWPVGEYAGLYELMADEIVERLEAK